VVVILCVSFVTYCEKSLNKLLLKYNELIIEWFKSNNYKHDTAILLPVSLHLLAPKDSSDCAAARPFCAAAG
jgi:hypothetical protein